MHTATWLRRAGWLGAFTFVVWAVPTAADEPPKEEAAGKRISIELEEALELVPKSVQISQSVVEGVLNDATPINFRFGSQRFGPYTLKLALAQVPKPLDAQLQLDGKGVLVISVVEDGPADKAGLKTHDILVAAQPDAPIKEISDVIKVVRDSDGEELTFDVLRQGKPITITIKPEVPSIQLDGVRIQKYREQAEEAANEATEKLNIQIRELEERIQEKLKDHGVDLRMQLIRPGQIVAKGDALQEFAKLAEFPEDLSIQVTKSSKDPAKIEVKQGDKSWTVTEDNLDELPREVRKQVETLLGRGGWWSPRRTYRAQLETAKHAHEQAERYAKEARKKGEAAAKVARERAVEAVTEARKRAEDVRAELSERLEQRLEEMTREMQEMRKRMEELRRSLRDKPERDADDDDDKEPGEAI